MAICRLPVTRDPLGHEALMVTNIGEQEAHLTIDLYF